MRRAPGSLGAAAHGSSRGLALKRVDGLPIGSAGYRVMAPEDDNLTKSRGGDPQEERLGELINEYFDRRESGEDLSQEDFIMEHAEHADALREHLVGLDLLDGLGASSERRTLPGAGLVPAQGSSAEASAPDLGPPQPEIRGYDIHKLIGRGGMGIVYKATHVPTKRNVALKLLLEGPLASEQSRRRFEREIAVAAQLKHPNIIPIYDSGASDGRMYYAMDYVRGLSLSEYLKAHKLDLPARLRLFQAISQAVLHAHQRGVTHRDLKPTNILVDANGEPHILDFGLAKAASHADNTTSMTAQLVGTPAYMSPEQTTGDPDAIDMRTDVYSLCVVLYEIVTGQMPYDTKCSIGKLLEHIATTEPVSPDRLNKKIDGDISAIVMKGLEKNKDHRYQSLDVLNGDIAHYLAGEPISVKPQSGLYLLRKVVWKNRYMLGFIAASVFITVTVALLLRHYTTKLNETGRAIQATNEALVARQAESESLRAQRDNADDLSATYEGLIRNLKYAPGVDPEFVKGLETVTNRLGESVRRGEDTPTAIARLLAQGLSDIPLEEDQVPSKDTGLDLDVPQMSPRPLDRSASRSVDPSRRSHAASEPKDEAAIPPEVLELLRRTLVPSPQPPPTSQPATTQASTQPGESPTTQPAPTPGQ